MSVQLDDTSPLWCQRLISELLAADERATALAKGLSAQQLNWKPSPAEWSVGQCLEHLRVTNEVYCGAISDSLDGRPHGIAQSINPGWFGRWFIRNYIEPSSEPKRRRAPKKIKPSARVEPTILDQFIASNNKARALIVRAGDYDVNRIRFKNPFIPAIRFTVGTGLEIVSKHEHRHLLQAERIRTSAKFPEHPETR